MGEPFLGEIRMFGFNFPPKGWAKCDGQLLPINQNQALFALLGTTYGGNGQTTFALPDLRGRASLHRGTTFAQGQAGGAASHTLAATEMPAHTHTAQAANMPGTAASPFGASWGVQTATRSYATGTPSAAMNAAAVRARGNGQPHENRSPYLVVNICIALQGLFPSQN